MAITRAQQFRQMLEDGGMLVSPSRDGRRPGYRRSNYDSSGGGTASSSKSSDRSPGPSRDDPSPQDIARGKPPTRTKKLSEAEKKAQREKNKADRKIFARNIKSLRPESGLSKIIKQGGFIPSILRNITDSKFNQDRRKKFMTDLDSLSKRFQTRRNINLPFGISFDANARTKNNLLQSLLAEAQEDLGLVAMSPGPFDYMNKRSIALSDLPKDRQDEIYDKVMDARMAGQTDAAGNLKAGFMFDGQGNIISTGNDGRDLEAEQLALLAQNQAAANAAASGDTDDDETPTGGLAFRFLADGGMPEDAPVGGIMDIESGRQMYFLGKLVKKATRAVKKVAKSPIGKAALFAGLAGAAGFGPLSGLKGKLFGTALPGALGRDAFMGMAGKQGSIGLLGKLGLTKGAGSMALTGKGIFSAITAASLLPMLGLGTGDEDEDEAQEILRGSGLDIASIRNNPYTFTSSVGGTGLGRRFVADGGRIGFRDGTSEFMDFVRSMGLSEDKLKQLDINSYNAVLQAFQRAKEGQKPQTEEKKMAEGGKAEPVAKETMPLLKMGGKEMDLRDEGGFVPIGRMERADDVPARLSKNEFVFTADAVRNAGGGDIDKGAEVMYNMMQNLESGGEVSEESQGLKGAREMFQTSKRLEEVL
jgi:hypothetical protein